MKGIYKLNFNCGRQGDLTGVFVEDDKFVEYLLDSDIYVDFGEVLGKHSDICGTVDPNEIELVTHDEKVVSLIEKYDLHNGHNPFEYTVGYWNMDVDADLDFDDWTVWDYINWKLNDELPKWLKND